MTQRAKFEFARRRLIKASAAFGTISFPQRYGMPVCDVTWYDGQAIFPWKNSNHYENFLLACKGEEETRSPFRVSAPLTQVFNLRVIAQRLGGVL